MSKKPYNTCVPIPTRNRCGYQMGFSSPHVHTWLESYDGKHPLLDIGCAYGINTLKAVEKCIPIVALDPDVNIKDPMQNFGERHCSSCDV